MTLINADEFGVEGWSQVVAIDLSNMINDFQKCNGGSLSPTNIVSFDIKLLIILGNTLLILAHLDYSLRNRFVNQIFPKNF